MKSELEFVSAAPSAAPDPDMATAKPLSPELTVELLQLADQLRTLPHGGRRQAVEAYAGRYGWSEQRVYTYLGRVGYDTGRKKRADAGATRLPTDTLNFIAASKQASVRANGKTTKPTGVAMNIADASGMLVNVSRSSVNRLLRERKLDTQAQAQARNTITLRSLFPNHLHEIDPSLCLVYYLGGKQQVMDEREFYKNKLDKAAKIKFKVWRYTRWDSASGSLDVRYYEAAGETQANLFEFLLYTWGEQIDENGEVLRLSHGRPWHLLWDKGSANIAHGIQHLLDALGVKHETHATHHAWAKGGVESGNRIVETHFESRLRDEPVDNVEQLNEAAQRWVRDYNANAIKHVDCRVRRASGEPMVRDDLWHLIQPEQLVKMPSREVCAWFMTAREETRQVRNLKISFAHPQAGRSCIYDLSPWARDIANGSTVRVRPLLICDEGEHAVRVEVERLGQEPLLLQALPEAEFDQFGRPTTGRVAVVGEERRSAPLGLAGEAAKTIAAATYGEGTSLPDAEEKRRKNVQPFQHVAGLSAHSHLGRDELPTRLPRAASELDTPAVQQARAQTGKGSLLAPLTLAEACRYIKGAREARGEAYDTGTYAFLLQRYADGRVPMEAVEAVAAGAMQAEATGTDDAAPAADAGLGLRRVK